MTTSIDAKNTAVPASREVEGFACPICDGFYVSPKTDATSARYLAGTCCAPRACGDCWGRGVATLGPGHYVG